MSRPGCPSSRWPARRARADTRRSDAAGPASRPAPDARGGTPQPLRGELERAARCRPRAVAGDRPRPRTPPTRAPTACLPARGRDGARRRGRRQGARVRRARTGAPVNFRGGGTSLNGQGQSDGIMVDVRRQFSRRSASRTTGRACASSRARCSASPTACSCATAASSGRTRLSTDIATVGGVIANNSGGMRCGVVRDSYSTVESMTLVLASGTVIDTAAPTPSERFAAGRAGARARPARDPRRDAGRRGARRARSGSKFEIKNTTGYRLCAFLDADDAARDLPPAARRIGGDARVHRRGGDSTPSRTAARPRTRWLFFTDIDAAAEPVPALVAAGRERGRADGRPDADRGRVALPGMPEQWRELPPEAAVLLVELRRRRRGRARRAGGSARLRRSADASCSGRPRSRATRARSRWSGACARGCTGSSAGCARRAPR